MAIFALNDYDVIHFNEQLLFDHLPGITKKGQQLQTLTEISDKHFLIINWEQFDVLTIHK